MNPKFIPTAPPVTDAVRAECPKELLKRLDKFTKDRDELVARCDAFAAEVETARVDEGIDAENEIVTGQLKARKIMLLKSALALRQELAELLNDLEKPARKAWDAACAEIPKVETELFDALVKLGYTDSRLPEFSLDPSRVLPGDLLRHPKVRAAKGAAEELRAYISSVLTTAMQMNRQAIDEVRIELNQRRERAFAGL